MICNLLFLAAKDTYKEYLHIKQNANIKNINSLLFRTDSDLALAILPEQTTTNGTGGIGDEQEQKQGQQQLDSTFGAATSAGDGNGSGYLQQE